MSIRIDGIDKHFGGFHALDDVSLDIPTGSTFGLIGSNGSGKSTLLKCMARILKPDKGSITVNGRTPTRVCYIGDARSCSSTLSNSSSYSCRCRWRCSSRWLMFHERPPRRGWRPSR